ncbi:MAG: PRC and DUF2382 domain-containing protein [Polyangiaceae bacterium]|nr:PRC and DUF2382 domain-containing protein [Polyangiaceae bacterium]
MQGALSRLRSWALDHKDQDIRGWAVRNADGRVLGTVDELIVDTDSKHVSQIVLSDGRRFAAHDLVVGDHALTVTSVGNGAKRTAAAVAASNAAIAATPVKRDIPPPVEKKAPVVEKKAVAVEKKVYEPVAATAAKVTSTVPNVAELVVPIIEEEFEVGKRRIDTGGVHVESRIVGKPFDQDLRIRDEQVKVDRRKVDQPLSLEDANARLREGMVEVTAKSEYPVVEKKTHVVEEIVVNRGTSERAVQLRDNLRRTDVEINEMPRAKEPIFRQEAKPVSGGAARVQGKDGSVVIPVVDEEMNVGKREYEAGGVRVTTRVASRPVDKTVTIREEHVNVQRRAVDRPIDAAEDAFRERALDLATYTEEPLVQKRARIVEEIHIHKDAKERVEHIHDTLRHTDVRVSELPGERIATRNYYEGHFKKNYLGQNYQFETVLPAYMFGEDLRRSMPNQTWEIIEVQARPLWEAKNPNTWDKFKMAIRNGWERIK